MTYINNFIITGGVVNFNLGDNPFTLDIDNADSHYDNNINIHVNVNAGEDDDYDRLHRDKVWRRFDRAHSL